MPTVEKVPLAFFISVFIVKMSFVVRGYVTHQLSAKRLAYSFSSSTTTDTSMGTTGTGMVNFASSDTDADGFLSPEEFSIAFFAQYDTDSDGLMSEEELTAAISAMSGSSSTGTSTMIQVMTRVAELQTATKP
jgi:EF hand